MRSFLYKDTARLAPIGNPHKRPQTRVEVALAEILNIRSKHFFKNPEFSGFNIGMAMSESKRKGNTDGIMTLADSDKPFFAKAERSSDKNTENKIKAVIVTDAPRTRITPAIRQHKIPVIGAITRFDCERKPSPEPILKGLEMLGCSCDDVLSVGNQLVDLAATHAAGIKFAACAWGMQEEEREELYKQADYIIENPIDLLSLLK